MNGCVYQEREKEKSEAQRGKPKGMLESEICRAISVLDQRISVGARAAPIPMLELMDVALGIS